MKATPDPTAAPWFQGLPMSSDFRVGTTGFEPATPGPPDRCATKLRHVPLPLTLSVDAHLDALVISSWSPTAKIVWVPKAARVNRPVGAPEPRSRPGLARQVGMPRTCARGSC